MIRGEKMKDTDNFIKIIKRMLVIIFICSLFYPLIIHFLFKWNSGCNWIIAEWESGDILNYGGAVLTAIGASILGLTTIIVQKRTDENNQLLQYHPKIEVLEVNVNKSVGELVKPYNETNPFPNALTLKRPRFDFSSKLKYREFYIICKNTNGIEPNSVKLVQGKCCNIAFDNGRRQGTSFIKYKLPYVDEKVYMFENCKTLNILSDKYITIDASNNSTFKIPVVVMYNEGDTEFIEDVNDSIDKNKFSLTLPLRFKNNLDYYEESIITFSVAEQQINVNKTRTYFDKENNIQSKKSREEQNNA